MIESSFFNENPDLGIKRYFHYDTETDVVTIETVQDVTEIIETNKYLANAHDERTPWNKKGMARNKVASIPMSIYYKLLREGILQDQERFHKWLNDPDNRLFRTRPGKI